MSQTNIQDRLTNERGGRALIEAYKQQITTNLYNEMLEEIKPKLLAAAKEAVAGLEVGIKSMLENYNNTMAFQLTVKGLGDGTQETTGR